MKSRLIPAAFLSRPNRFIVIARLVSGKKVRAHLGDPGRLKELLLPGVPLRLRPAPPGGERKTRYTVSLVRASEPPRAWVSLETSAANRLAEGAIRAGAVRGLGAVKSLRREYTVGRSRFDFLIEGGAGRRTLVEVKAVSLIEEGIALFPDAPTVRGTRHLRELAEHASNGIRAVVLFVVQRDDARLVRPHGVTDPGFAQALREARESGVLLRAVRFRMSPSGGASFAGTLRVDPR